MAKQILDDFCQSFVLKMGDCCVIGRGVILQQPHESYICLSRLLYSAVGIDTVYVCKYQYFKHGDRINRPLVSELCVVQFTVIQCVSDFHQLPHRIVFVYDYFKIYW